MTFWRTTFERYVLLLAGGFLSVLVVSCAASSDPVVVAEFRSAGMPHQLRVSSNPNGSSIPCVELIADLEGGSLGAAVCPTEESESREYAAAVALDGEYFVLGYGLRDGDDIAMESARRIIVTDRIGDRRFFLIEVAQSPGFEPFDIPIRTTEGFSRAIRSHGLDSTVFG